MTLAQVGSNAVSRTAARVVRIADGERRAGGNEPNSGDQLEMMIWDDDAFAVSPVPVSYILLPLSPRRVSNLRCLMSHVAFTIILAVFSGPSSNNKGLREGVLCHQYPELDHDWLRLTRGGPTGFKQFSPHVRLVRQSKPILNMVCAKPAC